MEKKSGYGVGLIVVLFIGLFLAAQAAQAQTPLSETYIAADNSFAFNYPKGWFAEEDRGIVYLNNTAAISELQDISGTWNVVFFGPALIASVVSPDIEADAALENVIASLFTNTRVRPTKINLGSRTGFRADFTPVAGVSGMGISVEIGEGVGVLIAVTDRDDAPEFATVALAIARTFDLPGDRASAASAPSNTSVQALTHYAGDYEEAIAELEQIGLIPAGGALIFDELSSNSIGSGSWFNPVGPNMPEDNIVMAGELTLRPGDTSQLEFCTLTSRINTNASGNATTFLDVGITNQGEALLVDRPDENADPSTIEFRALSLDSSQPHHLLILALGQQITVYVDGQLVFDRLPVVDRTGTFGLALVGQGENARRDGRNIWAYALDDTAVANMAPSQPPPPETVVQATPTPVEPQECTVTAFIEVNARGGPGTSFDSRGTLSVGEPLLVIGQASGDEGIPWWELESGVWVRSDLVIEAGDCNMVPEVEAE